MIPQRYNHTSEGMKASATGYWHKEEDVAEFLPGNKPQPIRFVTMLLKTGITVAIALNIYFVSQRIARLEREMIIQGYSKDFCKGY